MRGPRQRPALSAARACASQAGLPVVSEEIPAKVWDTVHLSRFRILDPNDFRMGGLLPYAFPVALTSSDYDASYFATVYGAASETGEPQQTRIDRARDRLLVSVAEASVDRPLSDCSVVDVGCGYGWLLDNFDSAKTLSGSDISEHAITMASKRDSKRNYRQADLLDGPPFDGTFDVVLAVNLIEHLTDPQAGVRSIEGLCKPGSVVLVHLPVVDNAIGRWIYSKTYANDPTHIYRPTGREVRHMFQASGFATLRESYLPHRVPQITRHLRLHPSYLAVFRK
jgi:2-polyprenyl-3-methyl-5-hydroxy-6-metoxy-1,4-benzoquinol methylase